jgi:hypothetical protein
VLGVTSGRLGQAQQVAGMSHPDSRAVEFQLAGGAA